MWLFQKATTLFESDLFSGMTDYHSHILPGVDDGVRTMEQAIEALKTYETLGIKEVWLTPHIMEDCPNRTDVLRERFSKLSETYSRSSERHPITLHLASENMLDPLFAHRLEENDLLPLADGKHLLVETSYYNAPNGLDGLLEQIIQKEYVPVLAHPERYHYMSLTDYRSLYGKGIKLQLNLFSLVGAYGEEVKRKSHSLLKEGLYSLLGSDLHRVGIFKEWANIPIDKSIFRRLSALREKSF